MEALNFSFPAKVKWEGSERDYNSYKDTDNATTSPSSQRQGQLTAKRSPKGLKEKQPPLMSKQQLENQGGVLGLEGRGA